MKQVIRGLLLGLSMILLATCAGTRSLSRDGQVPRLAILPFTGISEAEGESIALLLANNLDIAKTFTVIPRTGAIKTILTEQEYRSSNMADSDILSSIGKQLNADFVLAGYIQKLGNHQLVFMTIIKVKNCEQIAGDYEEFAEIEEVYELAPGMIKNLIRIAKQDTSKQPKLAVLPFAAPAEVHAQDAEVLAQLLAIEIANTGKYAVLPRTETIEAVMKEQNLSPSGVTDIACVQAIGKATGAEYVLAGNVRHLGTENFFVVQILNAAQGSLLLGSEVKYQAISDGLQLIPELSGIFTGKKIKQKKYRGKSVNVSAQKFLRIEGGTFMMGSSLQEPNRYANETQHEVRVSSFYLGAYEVTQQEYQEVMGINPSSFKGADLPAENLSWYDAVTYCNRRSEREDLTPAYTVRGEQVIWNQNADGYRLPTEAEWEYACRAGTAGPFNTGNTLAANQANYNGNYPYNNQTKGTYRQKTVPAGSFKPNDWGLYDMHGNVIEWCWDLYEAYNAGSQTDPIGASSGTNRAARGGSWYNHGQFLRSAYRGYFIPSFRGRCLGFRLAKNGH